MASPNVVELTAANWEEEVVKSDKPVLRITRTYKLAASGAPYELTIEQKAENLTDHAISLVWQQYGPKPRAAVA